MAHAKSREAREELDTAFHALTHAKDSRSEREARKVEEARVLKELHIKQLHDGTFHHTLTHENGLREEGSTGDLDELHDKLEENFGTENEGEERQEEGEEREEHSHY